MSTSADPKLVKKYLRALLSVKVAIGPDASKQDEASFLEAVAEFCLPGSYLNHLFNPNLVGWVNARISSDMPADVWDEMTYANQYIAQEKTEALAKVKELELEVARLKREASNQARLHQEALVTAQELANKYYRWYEGQRACAVDLTGQLSEKNHKITQLEAAAAIQQELVKSGIDLSALEAALNLLSKVF